MNPFLDKNEEPTASSRSKTDTKRLRLRLERLVKVTPLSSSLNHEVSFTGLVLIDFLCFYSAHRSIRGFLNICCLQLHIQSFPLFTGDKGLRLCFTFH